MHSVATFLKQMCSKFDEKKVSLLPETRTLAYLNNTQQPSLWMFSKHRMFTRERFQHVATVLVPIHSRSSECLTDILLYFPQQPFLFLLSPVK